MASGVIGDIGIAETDKSSYIKFSNGIIMVWGEKFVPSATKSSSLFTYYGTAEVNLSAYGIEEIFVGKANAIDHAAYWNAMISAYTNNTITLNLAGDNANGKNVRWFVIGRYSDG